MFHLQRASAGSGKTFALTKMFIKLFISRKSDKVRKLRRPEEMNDSLTHIMAVTFTNKATDEMKQRIVEKLAALAGAKNALDPKSIDYLDDFSKEFGVTYEVIADTCSAALAALLLNYSDFHVSTIDSFFQNILQTFAYEAEIDQAYNVEIDSEFVSAMGLDATLQLIIEAEKQQNQNLFWIDQITRNQKKLKNWNLFGKSGGSIYSSLVRMMGQLEKEEFKQHIKPIFFDYFETHKDDFIDIYRNAEQFFEEELRKRYEARKTAAINLVNGYQKCGLQPAQYAANYKSRIEKCLKNYESGVSETFKYQSKTDQRGFSVCSDIKNKLTDADKWVDEIDILAEKFIDACEDFFSYRDENQDYATWKAYRKLLPYLPLLFEISQNKEDFLEWNNIIQMSDTNSIIEKIVGSDDTPFIYERLGSQINHYLIDEFQDTSKMQWKNFLPLLRESHSSGYDNLIIGDAKQSIYRFRNADYTLISTEVEKEFKSDINFTSEDEDPPADEINTNWRSFENIVRFNNNLFSNIVNVSMAIGSKTDNAMTRIFNVDITTIYGDCVQSIAKDNGLGFVDLKFYTKEGDYESSPGFAELCDLIISLRKRGYRYKDIAILLRRNQKAGDAVIKKLEEYNTLHSDAPIPFISEENLLIARSAAVQLILNRLRDCSPDVIADLTLSGFVERIIDSLPQSLIDKNTPYIAAFQDLVIDYCSTYPSDIKAFLDYWDAKAHKLSINSSEETDAIRILTVHKAKGLEFKCVILPEMDYNFQTTPYPEWAWVQSSLPGFNLPPFLPIEAQKELMTSHHAKVWTDFIHNMALDVLNAVYVAFTRPICELYAYVPYKDNYEASLGRALRLALNESGEEYKFGEPLSDSQIAEVYKKEDKKKADKPTVREIEMNAYYVNPPQELPKFKEENITLKEVENAAESDESLDLRSRANLLHAVMEHVETEADLPAAILRLKTRGLISAEQADEFSSFLGQALASVRDRNWFSDKYKVLNERSIFTPDGENKRPDRILISNNGDAVIIDYKFGRHSDVAKYTNQVSRYMKLLHDTGKFKSVSGYLWYVSVPKIEQVYASF